MTTREFLIDMAVLQSCYREQLPNIIKSPCGLMMLSARVREAYCRLAGEKMYWWGSA